MMSPRRRIRKVSWSSGDLAGDEVVDGAEIDGTDENPVWGFITHSNRIEMLYGIMVTRP